MIWRLLTAVLLGSTLVLAGEIKPAADAPQPLPPPESLKRFAVPPGFHVALVASEPMLADPVAMAFDARGRIFVCELHGYNLDGHYDVMELNKTGELDKTVRRIVATPQALERGEKETYGTVKVLEDTDGDGSADRMSVWADHLPACYGVIAARAGVIVLCAPDIIYLADPDGDGRAEVRETLFAGFGVGELWTRINNPRWGVDNWIYAACGHGSAGVIQGPHLAQPVKLGNTGFRFKPDGSRFEPVSGGTSGFGLALNDWNDRFLVSNQEHALYVAPLPHHYLARNPFSAAPRTVINLSTYGRPARVFPRAPPDPWRLQRSLQPEWVKFYGAAETTMSLFTAACAPLIYRADQFPEEYRDSHFSCDSAYNLIHRCVLEPDGASFKARRAAENGEFLTSTEQWFRPVNLALGPEGSLYVVDMYREIIEDYTAIPRYLQQQYGLIAGHDKGRIWRVSYGEIKPARQTDFTQASAHDLMAELSSANAWRRETAQRTLVERGDKSAAAALRELLRHSPVAQARLHALYALDGLGVLDPALIEEALRHPHAGVRRHALGLADAWLDRQPGLCEAVLKLANDPDEKVRLQVAFTLGETRDPRRWAALAALAARHGDNPWMQAAILSSVSDSAKRLMSEILSQPNGGGAGVLLLRPLAAVIGARHQIEEIAECLETLARHSNENWLAVQTNALAGLLEALQRAKPLALTATNGQSALRQLTASPQESVRILAVKLAGRLQLPDAPEMQLAFANATRDALNPRRSVPERQAATELLASAPFSVLVDTVEKLLEVQQPLDLQLAAVAALATASDAAVAPVMLAKWNTYSPKVQNAVLDAVFRSQSRLAALLDALEKGSFPAHGLDSLRRSQLLALSDEKLRRRAEGLIARPAPDSRQEEVLGRYRLALDAPRDVQRGQKLFQEQCVRCHSLQGEGGKIGPDLGGSKGRAEETLLLDILQPSDQITAGYCSYNVITTNGEVFTGVLASESATSVTLPAENGREEIILRKDIASILMSEISLMPDNFADLLQPQDVADLLGYVREALAAGAPTAGNFAPAQKK